jgi:hypothetical protein
VSEPARLVLGCLLTRVGQPPHAAEAWAECRVIDGDDATQSALLVLASDHLLRHAAPPLRLATLELNTHWTGDGSDWVDVDAKTQ